jgi:hypothetical protein
MRTAGCAIRVAPNNSQTKKHIWYFITNFFLQRYKNHLAYDSTHFSFFRLVLGSAFFSFSNRADVLRQFSFLPKTLIVYGL